VPPRAVSKLAGAVCNGLNRVWDENAIAARMRRSWDDVADETYFVCLEALNESRHVVLSNAGLVVSDD
jgi:hypothetical protein